MLTEVICDKFRQKKIVFNSGFNVILGDDKATNSIGKSTFLMIIDFVFGGNTFLTHNKDAVDEIGDHEFLFSFRFDNDIFSFKRNTKNSSVIYKCNQEYTEVYLEMPLVDYTLWLKEKYKLNICDLSFRGVVGLFSRVWGKSNLLINRPLHVVATQSNNECVDNLIKLFNMYQSIESIVKNLLGATENKKVLSSAVRKQFIPLISYREYKANIENANLIEKEIEEIKENLSKFAFNITEIANREVLELKIQKDQLLAKKMQVDSKILRVRKNLANTAVVKSQAFSKMTEFFPNVDIGRLAEVENFHNGLSRILEKQLKASEQALLDDYHRIKASIDIIDEKIGRVLGTIENPSHIVDRVYELSNRLTKAKTENTYYEKREEFTASVASLKSELSETKASITEAITAAINTKVSELTEEIYSQKRRSPKLSITDASYKFEIFEDTGTGKAYANLIIFDLAILALTELPILIHDSLLFKNVENNAVEKIVEVYNSSNKQTFIAIDEIQKYSQTARTILAQSKVLQLHDNAVLYVKDWRTTGRPEAKSKP